MNQEIYKSLNLAGFTGYCSPLLTKESILNFISKIPEFTDSKKCLRIDQTSTRFSYKCSLNGIDSSLYLKVIHLESPLRYILTKALSCSLSEISASAAMELSNRNIETPPVYLVLVKKTGTFKEVSYIVTKEADAFTFIEPFIHGLKEGTVSEKSERIQAWAQFVKNMHDSGCYHFDLSNYNVMTRAGKTGTSFELIDLDMVVTLSLTNSIWASLFIFVELIIMNAMFKDRDFRKIDKLRFLKTYWGVETFRKKMKSPFVKFLFNQGELGRNKWFRRVFFNLFRIIRLLGIVNSKVRVEGELCHQNQA